jgi:hypothetical protein
MNKLTDGLVDSLVADVRSSKLWILRLLLCSLTDCYRRFEGIFYPHTQGIYPENGGGKLPRNVGNDLLDYTAFYSYVTSIIDAVSTKDVCRLLR